jgi:hypothetical protein
LQEFFHHRKLQFEAQADIWQQKVNTISWVRMALFLAFSVLIWLAVRADFYLGAGLMFLLFLILFALLIKYHNTLKAKKLFQEKLALINVKEVKLSEFEPEDFPDGEEFSNPMHPFSGDLDLFGKHSLFQLINRTETNTGRACLAAWMKFPANAEEIALRQDALLELSPELEWRQEFQARLYGSWLDEKTFNSFGKWLGDLHLPKVPLLPFFKWISPIISVSCFLLYLYGILSFYLFAIPILIHFFILKQVYIQAKEATNQAQYGLELLKGIGSGLEWIEQSDFKSEFLKNRAHALKGTSTEIKKLEALLDRLYNRANIIYGFINIFLLSDLHLVLAISKWKAKNAAHLSQWKQILAEIEAIQSLAGLAYSKPELVMPEICAEPYVLQGLEISHPLIHPTISVPNDFALCNKGSIALITGSNMAGKSTFLRTLGINMVLAYMGAPVFAKSFRLSLFRIFTCMRTEDDIAESTSSFYAELKRIKQLLEATKAASSIPVFYLLDEILKGTNSADRHKGAKGLAAQLHKASAMGLISTHDLELTTLEGKIENLKNYSFHCDIIEDKLVFDYKLKAGVCSSFNASKLMQIMGIEWDDKA